jgi:SSS family solute:Na+ symporter
MVTDPLTKKPNVDLIIPMFISKAFPIGITYIFMLTLLSAAMSTLSGQFHVIATSINYDLYNGEMKDDKTRLKLARIGIIIALIFTMIISLWLPGSIIAIATSIFFGLCAAAFLPMLIGALFWKRATTAGVTIGMLAGSAVYLFSLLFMHAKEASIFGVCKALTGKAVLFAFPWTAIDPLVLGLPVGLVAMYVASTLTKPIDQAHLTRCFEKESAPVA